MPTLNNLFNTRTQTLPYGAGSYQSPVLDLSGITPGPSSKRPVAPATPVTGTAPATKPVFSGPATGTAPVPTGSGTGLPATQINPATGRLYTMQELVQNKINAIPQKSSAAIPGYAGNAMASPDQSTTQLNTIATNLNNARNDIATGATDPYKIASQSGIPYSPAELRAIENAYAGIYDPALNDVFARLKEKTAQEKKIQDREDKIFDTNEQIRAWRATTGTKSGSTGGFTPTQFNRGAANAGMTLDEFEGLDKDIKNFYINPPQVLDANNKKIPLYQQFTQDIKDIESGLITPETVAQDITDSTLPEGVKTYFINQLPLAPEKKDSWFDKVWNYATGK